MEMLLIQDDSVLVIYLNLQMIIFSHEGGAAFCFYHDFYWLGRTNIISYAGVSPKLFKHLQLMSNHKS